MNPEGPRGIPPILPYRERTSFDGPLAQGTQTVAQGPACVNAASLALAACCIVHFPVTITGVFPGRGTVE